LLDEISCSLEYDLYGNTCIKVACFYVIPQLVMSLDVPTTIWAGHFARFVLVLIMTINVGLPATANDTIFVLAFGGVDRLDALSTE
jgi:hypothetical protein